MLFPLQREEHSPEEGKMLFPLLSRGKEKRGKNNIYMNIFILR